MLTSKGRSLLMKCPDTKTIPLPMLMLVPLWVRGKVKARGTNRSRVTFVEYKKDLPGQKIEVDVGIRARLRDWHKHVTSVSL